MKHKNSFKTKNTKDGVKTSSSQKTSISRREAKLEQMRIEQGQPDVQKERAKQSGKTKRATAYSASVASSTASVASNANKDQTIVYSGLATGGVGTSDASNTKGSESNSNNMDYNGIKITQ